MARFYPGVFDVRNIADAKAIILTPEDSTTEHRWKTETPYLAAMIHEHLELRERHRVLDFGCGIGRVAKELIARSGCSVVGVDTSVTMRALAPTHVQSDRFLSCPPGMLGAFSDLHHGIAIWTLQHIPDVGAAITLIRQHLRSFGKLFVVNNVARCLPMDQGPWLDDKKDVREFLCAQFTEIAYGTLEAQQTTLETAKNAFWGVYRCRS